MKFNIEIDIDWLDEEGSIDEAVQDQILARLTEKITQGFAKDVQGKIAQRADRLITAKTELLINTLLEKPVTISTGWGDKTEYPSVYDMVESKMTSLYMGKLGGGNKCDKDPLLANIEKYISNEVDKLLRATSRKVEKLSKISATKAVENHALVNAVRAVMEPKAPEATK